MLRYQSRPELVHAETAKSLRAQMSIDLRDSVRTFTQIKKEMECLFLSTTY